MKQQILPIVTLFTLLCVFSSCSKETITYNYDETSQFELDKSLVQINTTNVATGMEAIFTSSITDSTERAHFCQEFVNAARFYEDASGYFFIETLKDAWVVAHVNPDLIGTSRIDVKDMYGKYFIQDLVNTAQYIGYGLVEYYRLNPSSQEVERKFSFVTRLPTPEWFIGTGFYGDPPNKYYTYQMASEIIVKEANRTLSNGFSGLFENRYTDADQQKSFCQDFIQHIRFFDDQSGYFFILDYDCIVVAHGANPDLIGQDMSDYQDENGDFPMLYMVSTAKNNGEGYIPYVYTNPVNGEVEGKTAHIINIPGTEYVLGSGFYNK